MARAWIIGATAVVLLLAMRRLQDGIPSVDDLTDGLLDVVPDLPEARPLFDAPHQAPPLVRDLSLAEELARGLRPL